MEFFER